MAPFEDRPRRKSKELSSQEQLAGPVAFQTELKKEIRLKRGPDPEKPNPLPSDIEVLHSLRARLAKEEALLKAANPPSGERFDPKAARERAIAGIERERAQKERQVQAAGKKSNERVQEEDPKPLADIKRVVAESQKRDAETLKLIAELEALEEKKANIQEVFGSFSNSQDFQRRLAEVQNVLDYLDTFDGMRDSKKDREAIMDDPNYDDSNPAHRAQVDREREYNDRRYRNEKGTGPLIYTDARGMRRPLVVESPLRAVADAAKRKDEVLDRLNRNPSPGAKPEIKPDSKEKRTPLEKAIEEKLRPALQKVLEDGVISAPELAEFVTTAREVGGADKEKVFNIAASALVDEVVDLASRKAENGKGPLAKEQMFIEIARILKNEAFGIRRERRDATLEDQLSEFLIQLPNFVKRMQKQTIGQRIFGARDPFARVQRFRAAKEFIRKLLEVTEKLSDVSAKAR